MPSITPDYDSDHAIILKDEYSTDVPEEQIIGRSSEENGDNAQWQGKSLQTDKIDCTYAKIV